MMHIYMMSTLRAIAISAWMGDIYLARGTACCKVRTDGSHSLYGFLLALFMLILIVLSCMASQFCIVHLGL